MTLHDEWQKGVGFLGRGKGQLKEISQQHLSMHGLSFPF